jgi:hypothetical protein
LPDGANVFRNLARAAELEPSQAHRLGAREADSHVRGDLLVDVELQLFLDLTVEPTGRRARSLLGGA